MRKKLFGKLLSVALSATMAVTSAVPAYAATGDLALTEAESDPEAVEETEEAEEASGDVTNASEPGAESEEKAENGEGEEVAPGEVQEEEDLKEEETAEGVTEETVEEVAPEETAELTEEEAQEEELAELDSIDDVTIKFDNSDDTYVLVLDPNSEGGKTAYTFKENKYELEWDSTQSLELTVSAMDGRVLAPVAATKDNLPSVSYVLGTGGEPESVAYGETGFTYVVASDGTSAKLTINKKALTTYRAAKGEGASFDVKFAANTTKAASYSVNVIGTKSVTAAAPKVTFGSNAAISLAAYESASKPITSVALYMNDGEDPEDYIDGNEVKEGGEAPTQETVTSWYWDKTEKKVYISAAKINEIFVTKEETLTIKCDNLQYAISQGAESYGTVLAFSINGVPMTKAGTDFDNPLVIKIAENGLPNGNTTRTLTGAVAEVTYDDEDATVKTFSTKNVEDSEAITLNFATEETPAYVSLSNNVLEINGTPDIHAKSVVVTPITSEAVDSENGLAEGAIFKGIDSDTLAVTGKDYKFSVGAPANNAIAKVGYKIGEAEDTATTYFNELTEDNIYTIPGSKVTGKVTVVVEITENEKDTSVSATGEGFTIKDRDTGAILTSGGVYAKAGEDYYFTVTPADNTKTIKSVTYTIDGENETDADETSTTGLYKIPKSRLAGIISIKVSGYSMVAVTVPDNKKAIVYYNNVAQTKTFYVRDDVDFKFTMKGASNAKDGNITLSKVSYAVNEGASRNIYLEDVSSYNITVGSEQLSGKTGIIISAETNEEAKASTYEIVFTPGKNDNALFKLDSEGKAVKPYTLMIENTENISIIPGVKIGNSVVEVTSDNFTSAEFSVKSGKKTYVELTESGEEFVRTATLTAKKIGNDTLVCTLESVPDVNGNTVTYTGELALEVVPHYSVSLEAYGFKWDGNSNEAETSGTTGTVIADGVLAEKASAEKLTYAATLSESTYRYRTGITANVVHYLDEYLYEILENDGCKPTPVENLGNGVTVRWTGGTGVFKLAKGGNGDYDIADTLETIALVSATAASETAGSFNVTITEGDDVYTAKEPVSLYAVADDTYLYTAAIAIEGGTEELYGDGDVQGITLDSTVLKNATINYTVYRVNEKALEKADKNISWLRGELRVNGVLDATKVGYAEEDGYIDDVTEDIKNPGVEYYYTSGNDKIVPTYLSITAISGSKASYEATATASGSEVTAIFSGMINNYPIVADPITITVKASPAQVRIPLATNNEDIPVTLKDTYLSGKKYSRGWDKTNSANGYCLTAYVGTKLTLPTDAEWESKVAGATMNALVGWEASTSANGEDPVSYAPGESFIVESQLYKVEAKWAPRYAFVIKSESEQSYPLYREDGTVTEEDGTLIPVSTVDITSSEYSINAETEEGAKVGAVLYAMKAVNGKVVPVKIYPDAAATETEGTVKWYAVDAVEHGPEEGDGENTYTEAETLTILDSTALGKGYIKGKSEGKAFVYAVYTDEYNNKYESDHQMITVGAADRYELDIDSLPSTIEVDQEVQAGVVVYHGEEGYETVLDDLDGTFEWSITSEAGNANVEIEGKLTESGYQAVVKGGETGKVNVSLTYTDKNGVSVTSDSREITVSAGTITINITDKSGKVTTDIPEIFAETSIEKGTTTDSTSTLYVMATDKSTGRAVVDGTFDAVQKESEDGEDINLNISGTSFTSSDKDSSVKHFLATTEELGSATVTVVYQTAGASPRTYTKDVEINSYRKLVFDASEAKMVSDAVTENVDNSTKVKVTGSGGAASGNDYEIKIFEKDLDTVVDRSGNETKYYNLNLAPFKAAYSGDLAIDFAGWTEAATSAEELGNTNLESVVTKLEKLSPANYVIAPQFKDAAPTSINVSSTSIEINNLDVYDKLSKTVEVSVSPITAAEVRAKSSVDLTDALDGFFTLWDGGYVVDSEDEEEPNGMESPLKLTRTNAGDANAKVVKYEFAITAKDNYVGDAKVTVSAVGSDLSKDVTIKIYGQYVDTAQPTKFRYRDSKGVDAVDTSVDPLDTENDKTRFYDENGYLITTNRTGHDAKGNLVLLKKVEDSYSELVTNDGFHSSADDDGNDYFTKDGIILTGLIDVQGTQRYANTEGILVTYAMATEDRFTDPDGKKYGKYTDSVTGATYVIAEKDDAATVDHDHNWELVKWTWAEDYSSATASFKCTEGEEPGEAVAVVTSEVTEAYTKYTAKATFNEAEYTDVKFVDKDGKEITPHEEGDHAWDLVWKWNDDYTSATLSAECTKATAAGYSEAFTFVATIENNGIVDSVENGITARTAVYKDEVKGIDTSFGPVYFDSEGKLIPNGPHTDKHSWKPTWTEWTKNAEGEYVAPKLTLTCEVAGEAGYSEVVYPTVTLRTTTDSTKTYTTYIAEAYQDKEYFYTTVTVDKSGKEMSDKSSDSGEIYIELEEEEYIYTGALIQPVFTVYDGVRGEILAKGVDYTVSYKNNKAPTSEQVKAEIIVKGKGNYQGQNATAKFTILNPANQVDPDDETIVDLTGYKLALVSGVKYEYKGSEWYPDLILTDKNKVQTTYTWNDGYVDKDDNKLPAFVSVSNNINKGTATVLLTGQLNSKGKSSTLKKTFSIKAAPLTTSNIKVELDESIEWATKGSLPKPVVTWTYTAADESTTEFVLVEGQDYKVTYANNKKTGTNTASVAIAGKNNFSGTVKGLEEQKFTVAAFDLSKAESIATTAADGVKASNVKVTILDNDGNVIPASKLKVTVYDENDKVLTSDKLKEGQTITVVAEPKNEKITELTESASVDVVVGYNLSKASISVDKGFTKSYTGFGIELDDEDMKNVHVFMTINKVKKELVYGEDFKIAGYTNNVKKGTMKVTITGADNDTESPVFSGTKTFNVKIVAKSLQ